ncbi:hypothetical protein X975_18009, partial [Stegodyphus mimosarum]
MASKSEDRSGRPSITPKVERSVQEAIKRSPQAFTRRHSPDLGISHTTGWKTLRRHLNKDPYPIQTVHKLEPEDYAARQAMCYGLLEAVDNENLMENVLFSDETTFHRSGHANRHNCRMRADKQPNVLCESQKDTPKVNVWITIAKLCESFTFAERTITGEIYLDMLQQYLEPQLVSNGIIDSIVYQQNGAPPHFAIDFVQLC